MIRKATLNDLDQILGYKMAMFAESEHPDVLVDNAKELVREDYIAWYADGKAQHFVFESEGKVVACAGAFFKNDMPYRYMKVPFYGFIGDVYTAKEARGQGIATQLTTRVIEWLKEQGVAEIHLLAFAQARRIYEGLGFVQGEEMILYV